MPIIVCFYCKSNFSTKTNLIKHQKTAVYCLEIQLRKDPDKIKVYECDSCQDSFLKIINYNSHLLLCEKRLDNLAKDDIVMNLRLENTSYRATIIELNKQVNDLKVELSEERKSRERITLTSMTKPTTNVRNTIKNLQINNLTPLMEGEMREFLPQLTQEHVKDGAIGYARYALEYPLKGKFTVADASRKKLAWKNPEDPEGKIFYDNEGVELSKKFFRIIKERNFSLVREIMLEITAKKDDAVERGDQQECDACDDLMCKLDDYRRYVREASLEETKENELRDSFVKCLCSLSTEASKKTNN